jgi:hypothetical protein
MGRGDTAEKEYATKLMAIDVARIRHAQQVLSQHLPLLPTRLVPTTVASASDVFLKLESELPTGSFKVRGGLYSLMVNRQQRALPSRTRREGSAFAPRFSCPETQTRQRPHGSLSSVERS